MKRKKQTKPTMTTTIDQNVIEEIKRKSYLSNYDEYYDLNATRINDLKTFVDKGKADDRFALKVQFHFNIYDERDYRKLIKDHKITMQSYEETFYDTSGNDLMKRSIWCKRVVAGEEEKFVVKVSQNKDRFLQYLELNAKTIEDLKRTAREISQILYPEDTAWVFENLETNLKEYKFPVFRFTLEPKSTDLDYKITIDNMLCNDTIYTVCALQSRCTMEELDKLTQMSANLSSDIAIISPALSKIGFYLHELEPDLFNELEANIFTQSPYNTHSIYFDSDVMYSPYKADDYPEYDAKQVEIAFEKEESEEEDYDE